MRPHDLPPREHWSVRPHGERLRYIAGCRCVPCRAANSRYETEARRRRLIRGWSNRIVPADRARAHILRLSRAGVGMLAVAAAAHVPRSSVSAIRYRQKLKCREATLRKILAVTTKSASRGGQRIPAGPTWKLIDELLSRGWAKAAIAEAIGQPRRSLQLSRVSVTRRNAEKVRQVHEQLWRFIGRKRFTRWRRDVAV